MTVDTRAGRSGNLRAWMNGDLEVSRTRGHRNGGGTAKEWSTAKPATRDIPRLLLSGRRGVARTVWRGRESGDGGYFGGNPGASGGIVMPGLGRTSFGTNPSFTEPFSLIGPS